MKEAERKSKPVRELPRSRTLRPVDPPLRPPRNFQPFLALFPVRSCIWTFLFPSVIPLDTR
jgi:hypothetical protein